MILENDEFYIAKFEDNCKTRQVIHTVHDLTASVPTVHQLDHTNKSFLNSKHLG